MPDLEMLRRLAPDAGSPSDEARARVRATLLARIEEARSAGEPRRPRRERPGSIRRRWLIPASGLAAATAVALVAGLGTREGAVSAATAALRHAAEVARAQPATPQPGPGEYLYTRSVDAYLSTSVYRRGLAVSVLVPHRREIWMGEDGGLLRQTSGEPRFLSERDREAWITAGRPQIEGPAGEPWTTELPPAPPFDLPADPDALYQRLERVAAEREATGNGSGIPEYIFTQVGDALRETSVTPGQRAALYEVAARIPGVELVGEVNDPAGRRGVAFAMEDTENRIEHTLIIDPDTAQLLAEEQVALDGHRNGYPEATVVGHATYLTSAVVDSRRERPGGRG
jgi:RNA polymerase sigma-70 factor (ECF subfamily)